MKVTHIGLQKVVCKDPETGQTMELAPDFQGKVSASVPWAWNLPGTPSDTLDPSTKPHVPPQCVRTHATLTSTTPQHSGPDVLSALPMP